MTGFLTLLLLMQIKLALQRIYQSWTISGLFASDLWTYQVVYLDLQLKTYNFYNYFSIAAVAREDGKYQFGISQGIPEHFTEGQVLDENTRLCSFKCKVKLLEIVRVKLFHQISRKLFKSTSFQPNSIPEQIKIII